VSSLRTRLATATLSLCAAWASAQTSFPDGPVKMVVPLTPGSGADTAGRALAQALSAAWKQPVVIDNKPGAGGIIGTQSVVGADATGQTLLVQSVSYAVNPAIYRKLPYDPAKSLVDVAMIGATPFVMVTAPESPYATLKDLLAAAKAKPGGIAFASVGVGSSTHFAAEYLAQVGGVDLLHVPYKGGPEAIQDVMAGRAAFTMAALSTALPNIRAGKLRALGVSTQARSAAAPEIPTIAEQGHAGFDISLWFGVWAPAATPAAVVQRINADITRALQDVELVAAFARVGIEPRSMGQAEFAAYVREQTSKHKAIAQAARMEPQ
jgi:tripartite-type tricarboxylate transporter receptor subunit TctC